MDLTSMVTSGGRRIRRSWLGIEDEGFGLGSKSWKDDDVDSVIAACVCVEEQRVLIRPASGTQKHLKNRIERKNLKTTA